MSKRSSQRPNTGSAVSPQTKARVLEGAAQAFGRLGYANVRVEDIIEAAQVSRPTFYKLFASKDDVFEVLSERHHQEIRKRIHDAAHAHQDPVNQVMAMVHAFLEWRAGLGPVGRVLDLEARTPGTKITKHRTLTLRRITKLSADIARDAGRKPIDPIMTVALISALECVADALLLKPDVDEATLMRAKHIGFRIAAGTMAEPGEPLPPLPRPPST